MSTTSINTSFTLTKGKAVQFALGGHGYAMVDTTKYVIGNREAFIGPFKEDKTVYVYVDTGTITYYVDSDGEFEGPDNDVVKPKRDSSGNVVGMVTADGGDPIASAYRSGYRKPAMVRAVASSFAGAVPADTNCYAMAFAMPGAFDAVRIGFVHSGGSGAVVGMTAAVAATDDVGDKSNTNTAAGRRFVTPYRNGVENNTFSATGWTRLTVGGANSWGIADTGSSSSFNIAWSDIAEVHSVPDASGVHPLLLRVYGGTGAFTRVGQTGLSDASKWVADAGNDFVLGCFRVGAADSIGTLSNWSNSSNATFSDAALIAVIIEAWCSGVSRSVLLVGDSRFALPAPSLESTKSYKAVGFKLDQQFLAANDKTRVLKCCRGAQTNATVYAWAEKMLESASPTHAVYLCYSINNGVPTEALLNAEKTRTLKFIDLCGQKGVKPVLVPIFPYSAGFSTANDSVFAFNEWCKGLGFDYVDALAEYGDSSGGWKSGYSEDSNHMTDAGYSDLAKKIQAVIY